MEINLILPSINFTHFHCIFRQLQAKLEEDDKFQDFINPNTRMESSGVIDPSFRSVNKGDVVQLERKGFYKVDRPYNRLKEDEPVILFSIPDGKQKSTKK